MAPTTPAKMTHDHVRHGTARHGTTSLFAALDIASGPVIAQHYRRHRHQEFLRFHLHSTPTSVSCLNLVERWFAELTCRKLRRPAHRSLIELERDIRGRTNDWNKNPRPFVWTKTPADILDTLAAYRTRMNDSGH